MRKAQVSLLIPPSLCLSLRVHSLVHQLKPSAAQRPTADRVYFAKYEAEKLPLNLVRFRPVFVQFQQSSSLLSAFGGRNSQLHNISPRLAMEK